MGIVVIHGTSSKDRCESSFLPQQQRPRTALEISGLEVERSNAEDESRVMGRTARSRTSTAVTTTAATTTAATTTAVTTTATTTRTRTRRTRRGRIQTSSTNFHLLLATRMIDLLLLLFSLFIIIIIIIAPPTAHAQFNEPPGKRREQTFVVSEFQVSNINQHYPGELRYYCTFRGKWSKERHPKDFPKSPSWSSPVLLSHSKNWRMWTGTETVTAGVEYLAEEGFPTIMYNEFQNAGFETLQMIVGERMFNTTESQELPPINVTYSHPWLSAMTKITPSPDWFVGFSDLRTINYDTETYYNQIVIKSYIWDAGTDEGEAYHSFDRDLDPQVPCTRFCVPPYVGGGGSGTLDSNVAHTAGSNTNTRRREECPDPDRGLSPVPRAGQFLDYTNSYIPYGAEYECVLRVGDGEIYAGNEFHEDQIRPPLHVARPDDDFLDGISPRDQPAYDDHKKALETGEPVGDDDTGWNKNLLWLLLLLILVCCAPFCFLAGLYAIAKKRDRNADGGGSGGGGGVGNDKAATAAAGNRGSVFGRYSMFGRGSIFGGGKNNRDSMMGFSEVFSTPNRESTADSVFLDEASAEFDSNHTRPSEYDYDYDYDYDNDYDYDDYAGAAAGEHNTDGNGVGFGVDGHNDPYYYGDDAGADALMSSDRVGQGVAYQDEIDSEYNNAYSNNSVFDDTNAGPAAHEYEEYDYGDDYPQSQSQSQPGAPSYGDGYML